MAMAMSGKRGAQMTSPIAEEAMSMTRLVTLTLTRTDSGYHAIGLALCYNRPVSDAVIKLTVPGELAFRDVAIRAVAAACRLVRDAATQSGTIIPLDLGDEFDAQVVSAVSEIFNNIVIHGYNGDADSASEPPQVDFELRLDDYSIEVLITDHGRPFDIDSIPAPELESLPEGGMGIHIARSSVDRLDYTPGPPNRWLLTKRATRTVTRHSTQA